MKKIGRQAMNKYRIDSNMEESAITEYRYLLHEEKMQIQWINQVAKQAAKLMSEQLNVSNNNTIGKK